MKIVEDIEWYDGPLSAILSEADSCYAAFCIRIDFNEEPDKQKTYVLLRSCQQQIDTFSQEISVAASNGASAQVSFYGNFDGCAAALVRGDLEAVSASDLDFCLAAESYREFFVFPLIEKLRLDWEARQDQR